MKKRKNSDPAASIKSSVTKSDKKKKLREGLTRVGIITSPIKGVDTNARQWNRWTP